MDNQTHQSGECVEKFCAVCGEERGHVVASVTKAGRITRVSCPKCGTRSSFKADAGVTARAGARNQAITVVFRQSPPAGADPNGAASLLHNSAGAEGPTVCGCS